MDKEIENLYKAMEQLEEEIKEKIEELIDRVNILEDMVKGNMGVWD